MYFSLIFDFSSAVGEGVVIVLVSVAVVGSLLVDIALACRCLLRFSCHSLLVLLVARVVWWIHGGAFLPPY